MPVDHAVIGCSLMSHRASVCGESDSRQTPDNEVPMADGQDATQVQFVDDKDPVEQASRPRNRRGLGGRSTGPCSTPSGLASSSQPGAPQCTDDVRRGGGRADCPTPAPPPSQHLRLGPGQARPGPGLLAPSTVRVRAVASELASGDVADGARRGAARSGSVRVRRTGLV